MGNSRVPEVRFSGFDGVWEEKKLGEVAEFNPKSVIPDTFEYVDLESVVGTTLVSHRTEHRETAPSRAQRVAKSGDVFYQTVRPYQKNNYLFELPYDNFVFSTGYAQMRPYVESYFLMTSIQVQKFVNKVLDKCTGTSYPAISSGALEQISTFVPTEEEQTQIGNFFKQLDDTITLKQRELENLKQTKQGFLQKMFPKEGARVPEIRFAGFHGDWEKRKMGELFDILSGYSFKMSDYMQNGIPILNGESIQHGKIESKNFKYLPFDFKDKYKNFIVNSTDIVLGLNRPITNGTLKIAQVPAGLNGALLYQRAGKLIFLQNVDINFSYQLLGIEIFKHVIKEAVGSDQPFISTTKLKSWFLLVPSAIEEQTAIGNFFKTLDDTIQRHEQELENFKQTKKALLQKMFV